MDVSGTASVYIDTVILTPSQVSQLMEDINPAAGEENRTLTLNMTVSDTDEQAIEIPSSAVASMAGHNALLAIQSPFAEIILPAD